MTWSSHPDGPVTNRVRSTLDAILVRRRDRTAGEPEPRWVRAPADVRVRWYRPTRRWFIDEHSRGGYLTVAWLPAYRHHHEAMTAARKLAVLRARQHAQVAEAPC